MIRPFLTSSFLLSVVLGLSCGSEKGITVYDLEPTVTIHSPPNESDYSEGSTIEFLARVGDDIDPVSSLIHTWTSDIQTDLEQTSTLETDGDVSWATAALELGNHTITLEVIDTEGQVGSDTVTVTVGEGDPAPSITMLRPSTDESADQGEPYNFVAEVSDREDAPGDLQVEFTSDRLADPGFICGVLTPFPDGEVSCEATLEPGSHTLVYTVTDTDGYRTSTPGRLFIVNDGGDLDADDDGYDDIDAGGDDCDDTDASIHPGAEEIPYDDVDQDCDGFDLIDVDDDGHDAIVAGGDDCDDNDDTVFPGAAEICDDKDNNCDGTADEEGAEDCEYYYLDADRDDYGTTDVKCLCMESGDYDVMNSDDCDDTDEDANPAHTGWESSPRADGEWDWNCDTIAEKEYTGLGSCSGFLSCDHEPGWSGFEPSCGEFGTYVTGCSGVDCDVSGEGRTQRCR